MPDGSDRGDPRRDDAEYKLVARVGRGESSPSEILARTHFQARFFDSHVEGAEGPLD